MIIKKGAVGIDPTAPFFVLVVFFFIQFSIDLILSRFIDAVNGEENDQ
jgi:hypothetical protein